MSNLCEVCNKRIKDKWKQITLNVKTKEYYVCSDKCCLKFVEKIEM
ncbi:MAG: hypothetical protein ABIH25_01250 [Candidatus Woesearchaeota archaeon]